MKKFTDVTKLDRDQIVDLIARELLGWVQRDGKAGYWDHEHYTTTHGVPVSRWRRQKLSFLWHDGEALNVLEKLVERQSSTTTYKLLRHLNNRYECRIILHGHATFSGESNTSMAEAITLSLTQYALDRAGEG